MGIRFVWDDDRDRIEFESLVEGLMSESLGPVVTQALLRKQ
jgi:type IV pilus assembly protein PilZ